MYDVLIIGGGASGLMAACALSSAGLRVCLAEKQARVGRKLLSTGNGRCNLTNLRADRSRYHGGADFAQEVLRQFPPEKTLAVFRALGLPARADSEGRVYPMSNQAASVLDALRLYADENGCETRAETAVTSLRRVKGGFDADDIRAKNAIVCTGGCAAPKLGGCSDGIRLLESLGHTAVPCRPALTALKVPAERVRALKGQRLQGRFTLLIDGRPSGSEEGEIIFGDAGISGIAAMQLSRAAGDAIRDRHTAELSARALEESEALALLREKLHAAPKRALEDLPGGIVGKRVGLTLMKDAGVGPLSRECGSLSEKELKLIARTLSDWRFPITGVQGFDAAQVTAGGIRVKEFDSRTMMSRLAPGLYAAGEVLDVDGDCGGFNLQWAWASALTAAKDIITKTGGNKNAGLPL